MAFKKLALDISAGLITGIADAMLFTFYLLGTSFGKTPTSYGTYKTFEEAEKLLADFNSKTIFNALIKLKKSGYVTYQRGQLKQTLSLTPKGQARIRSLLPSYKQSRHWDGHIYLITYDVPETRKQDREKLRNFIRGLGAGMLQESVWLMFKDPKKQLKIFIEEKDLSGVVIVSNMGQNATIGDEDLNSLINRVYGLTKLNDRYGQFITQSKSQKKSPLWIASTYLSILKDDPQLPFELLPKDWHGQRAQQLYTSITQVCT